MATSFAALVSQLQTHISGGLRGQGNFTYSLEQIADELVQKRGETLIYLEGKGTPVLPTSAAQTLYALELKPRDWLADARAQTRLLDHLPAPPHQSSWHHCKIPKLLDLDNPVVYLGPAGRPEKWAVTRNLDDLADQQHRYVPRRQPLAYINNYDLWVTLRDGRVPTLLRLEAIFADPRQAFEMGLSADQHPLRDVNRDQTLPGDGFPDFPLDPETLETVRLRTLNLFLGTHGNRPIVPNNGNASI